LNGAGLEQDVEAKIYKLKKPDVQKHRAFVLQLKGLKFRPQIQLFHEFAA